MNESCIDSLESKLGLQKETAEKVEAVPKLQHMIEADNPLAELVAHI